MIVAGGLINVWIFRNQKPTGFRGGQSQNLKDEFKEYGLSEKVYYLVGALKLTSALLLILGVFIPKLVLQAAAIIVVLMLGAICMHVKVSDPIKRSLPAIGMLIMSSFILANASQPFI